MRSSLSFIIRQCCFADEFVKSGNKPLPGAVSLKNCSNYIFIIDWIPGFSELDKDNCRTRREIIFWFGAIYTRYLTLCAFSSISWHRDWTGRWNLPSLSCQTVDTDHFPSCLLQVDSLCTGRAGACVVHLKNSWLADPHLALPGEQGGLETFNTLRPRQGGCHFCRWHLQMHFREWKLMDFK